MESNPQIIAVIVAYKYKDEIVFQTAGIPHPEIGLSQTLEQLRLHLNELYKKSQNS